MKHKDDEQGKETTFLHMNQASEVAQLVHLLAEEKLYLAGVKPIKNLQPKRRSKPEPAARNEDLLTKRTQETGTLPMIQGQTTVDF